MKSILTITLAALLVGCGTTSPTNDVLTCDRARQIYELYQASLLVRQPSDDEVRAAQVAAAVLTVQCGWTRTRSVDGHGVPVIVAP